MFISIFMPIKRKKSETVNFKESFLQEGMGTKSRPVKAEKPIKTAKKSLSFWAGKSKNKNMSKTSRPISIYKKIAASFIVLTLLLVFVVVYFSVVSVKIIIIPNKERTATSFIATVQDESVQQGVKGMGMSGIVEKISLNVSDKFKATGKDVTGTEVSGTVTIHNTSKRDQPLIKTTRLLSPDNKLYRLKETVRISAGEKIENVEVYADQPDREMEIGPTRFTIPGLSPSAQELIYAESQKKFVYQETGDTLLSAQDIEQAKAKLKLQLEEKIQQITEGDKYKKYDNIVFGVKNEEIKYTSEAKVGDEIEEFNMVATVEGTAVVGFSTEDVAELALLKVSEALPDDKELESFNEDNFVYSIDRHDLENKTADVKIEVVAQMILKSDTDIIKTDRLVGLTREQLDDYLSSLREIAGYEVKFTPRWINKVPALADHVKVEIAK